MTKHTTRKCSGKRKHNCRKSKSCSWNKKKSRCLRKNGTKHKRTKSIKRKQSKGTKRKQSKYAKSKRKYKVNSIGDVTRIQDPDGRGSYWFYYDGKGWKEFKDPDFNDRTATREEAENEAKRILNIETAK